MEAVIATVIAAACVHSGMIASSDMIDPLPFNIAQQFFLVLMHSYMLIGDAKTTTQDVIHGLDVSDLDQCKGLPLLYRMLEWRLDPSCLTTLRKPFFLIWSWIGRYSVTMGYV